MKLLFIFLDGVGLGVNEPDINPFAQEALPQLQHLLGGAGLFGGVAPVETEYAAMYALDACLGVEGLPQSATGQATLLSGRNVPAMLGYHYGPKPNRQVANLLRSENVFRSLARKGRKAVLLNAYPPRYFSGIESGRRLYSAIPLAVTSAGIRLRTMQDLYAGQAFSADFTGQGWREHLGISDAPVLTPEHAGERLALVAGEYDFALFEYWLTDAIGHRQDMAAARSTLNLLGRVFEGLFAAWDFDEGLIMISSDHGNLEDLSTRRHTRNHVPAVLIGPPMIRRTFADEMVDLTGVASRIQQSLSTRIESA